MCNIHINKKKLHVAFWIFKNRLKLNRIYLDRNELHMIFYFRSVDFLSQNRSNRTANTPN